MAEDHFVCDTTGCDQCIYWDKYTGCCDYYLDTGERRGAGRGPTCTKKCFLSEYRRLMLNGIYSRSVRINSELFQKKLKDAKVTNQKASFCVGKSAGYIHKCLVDGRINKDCLHQIAEHFNIDFGDAVLWGAR